MKDSGSSKCTARGPTRSVGWCVLYHESAELSALSSEPGLIVCRWGVCALGPPTSAQRPSRKSEFVPI
jgi:hypothetical protein